MHPFSSPRVKLPYSESKRVRLFLANPAHFERFRIGMRHLFDLATGNLFVCIK